AVSETGSETRSQSTCPVRSKDCDRFPTAMCGKTPGSDSPGPDRPSGVTWELAADWFLRARSAATDSVTGATGRPSPPGHQSGWEAAERSALTEMGGATGVGLPYHCTAR